MPLWVLRNLLHPVTIGVCRASCHVRLTWLGTRALTPTTHSCSECSSYTNLILNLKQVLYSRHVCSPAWLAQLSPYNTFGFTPRMFVFFSMPISVTDGEETVAASDGVWWALHCREIGKTSPGLSKVVMILLSGSLPEYKRLCCTIPNRSMFSAK